MIKDVTGIILTPGNMGKDCMGNGEHFDKSGQLLECCCDECDYLMCCTYMYDDGKCISCGDMEDNTL